MGEGVDLCVSGCEETRWIFVDDSEDERPKSDVKTVRKSCQYDTCMDGRDIVSSSEIHSSPGTYLVNTIYSELRLGRKVRYKEPVPCTSM